MQPDDLEAVADVVAQTIQESLAPVLERLAVLEARVADREGEDVALTLGPLRERLAVVETKATIMPSAPIDLTPVLERVAAAEARLQTLGDLRDRVVTIETTAALAVPPDTTLRDRLVSLEAQMTPLRDHQAALEARLHGPDPLVPLLGKVECKVADLEKDLGGLRERVAVVETRPLAPGPPGPSGQDGMNGQDGRDGLVGLSFEGVYQDGRTYEKGHLVTWAGSSWHCNEPTATKPGDGSKAWTLMVKRGRDGKDGQDAPAPMPVVSVGGGR